MATPAFGLSFSEKVTAMFVKPYQILGGRRPSFNTVHIHPRSKKRRQSNKNNPLNDHKEKRETGNKEVLDRRESKDEISIKEINNLYPTPEYTLYPNPPESWIGRRLGTSLELEITGILDIGTSGIVYSAIFHPTRKIHAVKALSKLSPEGKPLQKEHLSSHALEISLHYKVQTHPCIVSIHKIIDEIDCVFLILDYYPDGDLFANIISEKRFVGDEDASRRAFLQILDAVQHCHELGVYHRDLKPENVLVDGEGERVVLADFDLASMEVWSSRHGCGSTFYMSPECLDQSEPARPYKNAPADIWSLGVILVNLTCGRNPWKQASVMDATYRAFTKDKELLKIILPVSDELNGILVRVFEADPEKRITISELREAVVGCSEFFDREFRSLQESES